MTEGREEPANEGDLRGEYIQFVGSELKLFIEVHLGFKIVVQ